MTHRSATVRDGQIVVRGLGVPDGTRVVITVEPDPSPPTKGRRRLPEFTFPPDIAEGLDQSLREADRGETISWEESNANLARERAEWIRRDEIRRSAKPDGSSRPKRRGKVVAGQSRPTRTKPAGTRDRARAHSSRSKP